MFREVNLKTNDCDSYIKLQFPEIVGTVKLMMNQSETENIHEFGPVSDSRSKWFYGIKQLNVKCIANL